MVTTAQKGALGVSRPALSLAFAGASSLDSRITFTRASIGTDFDSTGTIVQFGSGSPRFGYDPTTKVPLGLLIEEARTNLFLNSLLNGTNLSTQTVTVSAVQYALSFYGTGTITMTGGFIGSLVGTGAFPTRSVLVFTATAVPIVCTVSGTVQYAQLEATSANYPGPTSLIPTAGTTVARAADVATMTGTNFSSWYNQSAGTFVVQATPPGAYNTLSYALIANSAGGNNVAGFLKANAAVSGVGQRQIGVTTNNSGTAQAQIVPSVDISAATFKAALAFSTNNVAYALNGSLIGTASTAVQPVPTQLGIGVRPDPLLWLNGHVGFVNYYNTRLSNGKSQSLTS